MYAEDENDHVDGVAGVIHSDGWSAASESTTGVRTLNLQEALSSF